MIYLEEKTSKVSKLIENQFPVYVQQNTPKFLKFITAYYESQEGQYQPYDIASNLVEYYNIGYYRPNRLTENTILTGNVLIPETTINVKSTQGFPHRNGYIKINDEIIFYRDKTATTFTNCVRGTKALVLDNIPKSHLTLTTSTAAEHLNKTKVVNLAYNFANEFLSRIKKEIAPFIPEVLDSELDLGGFLKNIKSFYSTKGSLYSHRTLFRILFNDRKFKLKLKARGSGAIIKVQNIGGSALIASDPQEGGTGYDSRKAGGALVNPPIVEVFGTGKGTVVNNTRPNKTAKISVTDIDANTGAILTVNLDDPGEAYVGPITARVRPTKFREDEIVTNLSNTGSGKVEFYDAFKDELILYDVVGYFSPEDDVSTLQGEQARAIVKRTDDGTGVIVEGEQQQIEFPKEYTFKTSASDYIERKVLRCKLLESYSLTGGTLPDAFSLVQDSDELFGIKGVMIEADNSQVLSTDIFDVEVSTNTDLHDIYLQPTSLLTKPFESSDTILTVDDASRFPVANGIICFRRWNPTLVRWVTTEVRYTNRSVNQFFGCTTTETFTGSNAIPIKTEIISFGRLRYDQVWATNQSIKENEYRYYGDNLYLSLNDGTTGNIPPVHTSGNKADGSIASGTPVTWKYYSRNRYDHSFYIDYKNPLVTNPRFKILGLPGDVVVTDGASLHTNTNYEFSRLNSPNSDYYHFTTNELSDRLAVVLGSNVNRTRNTVTDSRFASNGSLYGFNNQYDYGDHVYVASSGIPRWWDDLIPTGTPSAANAKKIAFENQKIVQRWKKSSLVSDTQAIGPKDKTKKTIGLNIDGIQVNSYKGSTVEYGAISKFFISTGGTYPVPYDSTGLKVDLLKLPKFDITGTAPGATTAQNTTVTITLSNTSSKKLIRLSSSIKSIDFNKLTNQYLTDGVTSNPFYGKLTGFDSKPVINVINNNPNIKIEFINFINTNPVTNEIIFVDHGLVTGDKVTFKANDDYFDGLTPDSQYYVRKVRSDMITVHATKSDALLNQSSLSLQSLKSSSIVIPATNPPVLFSFETDKLNPVGFKPAVLDISYANGNIDNIIIRESGFGYVELPTIRISGGGKTDVIDVPFQEGSVRFIEASGSLISYDNFNKTNSNEIDGTGLSTQKFIKQPTIKISDGKDASATAYVANGGLFNIVITNPGENYFIPPAITLSGGGGTGGVVTAETNASGQIIRFNIVNKGSGYRTTPRVVITPLGSNGGITPRLKEWTFNLIRRFKKDGRLDDYGGYVYDSGDKKPSTDNERGFDYLNYTLDFPKDINEKQYFLMHGTDRLRARYIYEKNVANARAATIPSTLDSSLVSPTNPDGTKPFKTWADANANYVAQLDALPVHTPVMGVSYDGIPFYSGKKVNTVRNIPDDGTGTKLSEIQSRYRLKYTEVAVGTAGALGPFNVQGVNKYVTLSRDGGPSIDEYPIGTFIEDYEYEKGGLNDLDEHNGRFCITPDFPDGRYLYFITTSSYDGITNELVNLAAANNNGINFNGFPYFIGDKFAGECDGYMNNQARTNDKIPKAFTRAYEKQIDDIPTVINGAPAFRGLPPNNEYPQEDIRLNRTIANTGTKSQGTVDSVIIESAGDNYGVGDRLTVDNSKTFGSDFSAFVSRVRGKDLRKKTDGSIDLVKSSNGLTVTFQTNDPHYLAIGDYVYFDYKQPLDPATGLMKLVELAIHNNGARAVSPQITRLYDVQIAPKIIDGVEVNVFENKEIYSLEINSRYTYKIYTPALNSAIAPSLWYEIDATNEWFQISEPGVNDYIKLDGSKIPDTLYLHSSNYIYVINKVSEFRGSHVVSEIDSTNNKFTVNFNESTLDYNDMGLYYAAKSYGATGPIDKVSVSNEGFGYRSLPEVTGLIKRGTMSTIAGDGKAVIQTNSNTIGKLRSITYSSLGNFTQNENVNYYLNLPATAKLINNFEISSVYLIPDPNGVNPTGGLNYDNAPIVLLDNIAADGTKASIGNAHITVTVVLGTITKVTVINPGAGFTKEPIITIQSTHGSGALFRATIQRKRLPAGDKLFYYNPDWTATSGYLTDKTNSKIFGVPVEATVVSFDEKTSTLVFNEDAGQFNANADNNIIKTSDGIVYGKITSIRRSKAYAKVSPYGKLEKTRKDIIGNSSENLQKITDSHYYQDWSYSLTTSRDTKEWKDQQDVNTHAAGFKQFGRKVIERRKGFFDNPADVFSSSVIFTTTLSERLDLGVGLSPCSTQTVIFGNASGFTVGTYVIGLTSKTIAYVLSVGEYFVKFRIREGSGFVVGELVLSIPDAYAFNIGNSDATDRNLVFWQGLLQEPTHSYTFASDLISISVTAPHTAVNTTNETITISNHGMSNGLAVMYTAGTTAIGGLATNTLYYLIKVDNNTIKFATTATNANNGTAINLTSQGAGTHTITTVANETFVPNFSFANNDNIHITHPNVNKFDILKTQTLTTSDTTLSFEKVGQSTVYPITNLGKVIISVAGSVQNPANLTVSNNVVNFGSTPAYDSRVFAIGHQNLNSLTFAGSATGTQFTLNYTPSSNCKLIIFETSVFQTHIVPPSNYTVSGNVITFSSTATKADLFGWYIDEDTRCFRLNTSTWNDRQVQGILGCRTKRFNEHIESNAVKAPSDVAYEVRAKNISGTVYGTGSNSIKGYDTRFTYTSPSHSSSFVEVLEAITFNGSTKTFNLIRNGVAYNPTNGEESLVVYLDNAVLDHDKYTVVGSQIIFTDAHASTVKCTLIDYVSSYLDNTDNGRGAILDRLGQNQTGTRVQWNLSDDGVPQYVANPTDIFAIKNGTMLRPDSSNYTVSGNLITFVDPPTATDVIKLPFFNRQLLPASTNNVILDEFKCNNGTTTVFPITSGGLLFSPIQANLFVMRNGVMQRSGTDYTVSTNQITFTTPPTNSEIIFGWYSYDGVNQNIMLDNLTGFNNSTATFNLTHSSGTAFTPPDVDDLMVVRNGVVQNPTQDYTVSGSQITFTTAPAASEQVWILYTHGAAELTIASQSAVNSNSWKITMSASPGSSAAEYRRIIVYADGAPRFLDRNDFTVSGNDIILDHTGSPAPTNVFVIKYVSVTQIDDFDYCPDGVRTQFKMFLNGANIPNTTNTASILVSVDGIIKDPSSEYTFSANRGFINFTTAPPAGTKLFMVRMSNNLPVTLSASGSNYTISQSISAASGERDNLVIFSNNTWKFAELGDFTWVNDNTITLATAHTTGTLFGIKFTSIFKLLDQTNTAFANIGDTFTLFDGRKRFTPTNATYNPANGNLVLTIPNHGLIQNSDVRIEPNSLKFKCNMDSGYAIKSYPRTSDPKYNTDINCDAVTTDTITLNVGTSPLVNYTPGNNTTYDPTTGDLVLNIGTTGANALSVGESIKLADGAVTFTCDSDNNQSNHAYPRTTIDLKTPEAGTTYNPTTGVVTIKVTTHGFKNGDLIKLNNGALRFECTHGVGTHNYPRPTDRMGNGKWAPIFNVTTDTFDIQVLDSAPSTNTTTHTFISAVASSLSRKRDRSYDAPVEITAIDTSAGTITVNVGKSSDTSNHTFVANSGVANSVITGGNYAHTFVSANPRCIMTVGFGTEGQRVFTPVGTTDNDNIPDETSLLVVKNGLILEPKVDYELVGDNKTQIKLAVDPIASDVISIRSVGSFNKLDTLTNGTNVTELTVTKSSTSYYPNAHIERPRQWANQYLVVKDGAPLSPLYDYYISNDKIHFTSAQTFTKLVILDFRGTADDIKVLSRGYEVVVGDQLTLSGEDTARTVTGITSPTVLTTSTYSGDNIFTWGSGVLGSTTISNGKIASITTTSGSVKFKNPVILRTEGTGVGAKASATVSIPKGGEIVNSSIDLQYPGYNVYNTHKVFPTVYASTFKKEPMSKTEVRKGTKLTSNITNSVETIPLNNTTGLTSNPPTFTITGTHSGSNASFKPFISGGELRKVEIISGGTGYDDRDINITLTGGGGTGCVLEPVLNGSGTVTSLTIKNPGVGYDTNRVILYKTVSNVVNAEIVEYTTHSSSGIDGCTRGVLGTAQAYSANDIVYFDNYI